MGRASEHQQKPKHRQYSSSNCTLQQLSRLFGEGSVVEVQTDEEDFRGVYFLATIIPSSPHSKIKSSRRNFKKIHVEYHNLLVREDEQERLKEYVDASFVRPAPPPQEDVKGFELNDSVDAFFKDGWWIGVVTRVLEGDRFIVTFQYPPDELEFGLAELRVHWDWCDRSWVRPEKQAVAASMFDVGKKVEVSFDDEFSKGAWFPATILKVLKGTYLVEHNSLKIGLETELHKVTVDSSHVRPCVPSLKDINYLLLEKVDSFFNFGWRSGVITKVLEDCRYIVFFKEIKKEKEFHQSEIRPHMEWKDGKWFTSSCFQLSQDVSIQSLGNEKRSCHAFKNDGGNSVIVALASNSGDNNDHIQNIPCLFNLDENQTDSLIPSNQKSSYDSRSLSKRGHSFDGSNVLSQPLIKPNEGLIPEACQQDTTDRSTEEFLRSSPVNDTSIIASPPATDKKSPDNHSRRMAIRRKLQKLFRNDSTSRTLEKNKTSTIQLERSEPDDRGKEKDEMGNAVLDHQNGQSKNEVNYSLIIGLPCVELGSEYGISGGKSGLRHSKCKEIMKSASDQKEQSGGSDIENMKSSKQSETREFIQKRKRGRPCKKSSPRTLITGNTNGDVASPEVGIKDSDSLITVEAAMPNPELALDKNTDNLTDVSDCRNGNKSKTKKTLLKVFNDKESIRLRKNTSSKRRRLEVEAEKVNAETPDNESDDGPLSKWIVGMQSPPVIKDSEMLPVKQCAEKSDNIVCIDKSEKKKKGVVYPSSDGSGAVMPNEQQGLPFARNTVLWKTIDSMEVFHRFPQKPHFQPLIHLKESAREGLAVGYMVTFSTAVEKASRLQINDPKTVTDDILETLADLEKYGFDARVVKDHVIEMLAIKHKQEKLIEDKNGIDMQIVHHNTEKQKIDKEISEMKEQILKLQGNVSVAASVREEENSKIAGLQSKLQKVEESMNAVERELENLSASLMN